MDDQKKVKGERRRKAERQIILDLSLAFFLFGSCWPVKYVDKIYGAQRILSHGNKDLDEGRGKHMTCCLVTELS